MSWVNIDYGQINSYSITTLQQRWSFSFLFSSEKEKDWAKVYLDLVWIKQDGRLRETWAPRCGCSESQGFCYNCVSQAVAAQKRMKEQRSIHKWLCLKTAEHHSAGSLRWDWSVSLQGGKEYNFCFQISSVLLRLRTRVTVSLSLQFQFTDNGQRTQRIEIS